ncbi:MAG: hypothetical protein B9S36_01045 [Verrucomicrobiia bacterium Tous-C2TDCM]|nr:MAG: hypothetical protein B9S36_01045 [Verrucomicrobiae bacterium Tous-C2TDCM]
MTADRQPPLFPCLLAAAMALPAAEAMAQGQTNPGADSFGLPNQVTADHFAALRQHSPFLRTLDLSKSLIITGVARIDTEPVATLLDLETRKTSVVSRNAVSPEGWQLVEMKGSFSDIETLTAKIKMAGGSEIFSIRYEKSPPPVKVAAGATVSTKIGNGTAGGGTDPHGGPDPRVLTPDQMNDARNAARNIKEGFKADGYGDNQTIPPEVVSKISRLSVEQRESINVKMYEYRNRGLGMPERQQIYNRMLDEAVRQR